MQPLIPNSTSNNCGDVTGSNCVPYNGTPIPCLPNCTGWSVSDVLYNLGQESCYIQSMLNMSGLDLSCFYTPFPSCQNPTQLIPVLQLMINYMCSLQTQITSLQTQVNNLTSGTGSTVPCTNC